MKQRELECKIYDYKGKKVIALIGELNGDNKHKLLDTFSNIKDDIKDILIINFKDTTYINSAGIAALVGLITIAGKEEINLYFVELSSHLKRIMDIVGLSDFVTMKDSMEEI